MSEKFSRKFLMLQNKKIEITRFIGEGNLGGTWEIKNELGYPKALKILYKTDKNDNQTFLKKFQVLKKIVHPNLIKIDEYGIVDQTNIQTLLEEYSVQINRFHDAPYIVIPYASLNLADYIVMDKENLQERIQLSIQLLRGLRKIHSFRIHDENNIVKFLRHGNLKPSNILLVSQNKSYRLKISDLGIDLFLNVDTSPFKTQLLSPETNDFTEVQKIVDELFSFNEIFQLSLPKITDDKSIDKLIQHLRSYEKEIRKKKLAYSYIHLGSELYYQSLFNYALKDFDKALEIDDQIYEGHLYKGHILRDTGKNEEALPYYNEAIKINNKDPRAYEGRSEALANLNKQTEAITDLEKAIALEPERSFCHAALGMLHKKQKNYNSAIKSFTRLIELEEDCIAAYIDRGDSFLAKEEFLSACEDYEKAWSLDKENEEVKAKLELAKEKARKN